MIDYALTRRAVLADLFAGRASTLDVCDAHPYLLRAAKHHGRPTERPCPVCRHRTDPLMELSYVYGDSLGDTSGRPRSDEEIAALARAHADLHVYLVEVCVHCSWNHLLTSSVVGVGRARTAGDARRRSAQARPKAREQATGR